MIWNGKKDGVGGSGIFNGDMGRITAISVSGGYMTVDFDGRKTEYDFSLLEDIEHAYAITVHKSQGSEYPIVILPAHSCPPPLDDAQPALYGGHPAQKTWVVALGDRECIRTMVNNDPQGAALHASARHADGRLTARAGKKGGNAKMTGRFWKLLAPQKCLYCNEPTDDPDGAVCDRCLPEEERLLDARCPVMRTCRRRNACAATATTMLFCFITAAKAFGTPPRA